MEEVLFSIIIPFHNRSKELERLLDSVPWKLNLEVIVVDDASADEEVQQVKSLQQRYLFELYHIEKHTAGAARNEGLRHAHGRWLVFADADDYFLPEADSLLMDHADDAHDVVYFKVKSTWSENGKPAYRDVPIERLFAICERENSMKALRALHTNPWGKMIRRHLVEEKNIRFEEIASANDAMFSVRCGVEAHWVTRDNRALYCITVSEQSLTSNMTAAHFESNGQARLRVNAYLREHRLEKYQLPVLGYMLMSWSYGPKYGFRVMKDCYANGNNPWVDWWRLLMPKRALHSLKSRPK